MMTTSISGGSVFRNRSFSFYFAGQSLSYVGDGLRTIAIPLLVYHLTNSASALGVTYALEFAPFALFGLVGGSLADRLDRRALMIGCDFARFAIVSLFALAYWSHSLTISMLYAGIVVLSLCAAVFQGGQASAIPFLIGKDRATQGVAALIATEQASSLIAPPIGGAIFAMTGPLPALVINAFTYLCSQASVMLVPTLGPRTPSGLPSVRDVGADIVAGYRFFCKDTAMWQLTIVGAVFNFFGLLGGAVFIPFLKRDLGGSDLAVGLTLGGAAIGSIAGSIAASKVPKSWPLGKVLQVSYALDGLLFLPVMFAQSIVVAAVFLAVTNALVVFEVAQIVGWRMRIIPEDMVGRVFGVVRFVVLAGAAPGAILGGLMADRYGARLPLIVGGIGYIAVAAALFFLPSIRRESR
jgi:MFS family permease